MNFVRRHARWIAGWAVATVLVALALARLELASLSEAFETDMRIAHRLLSQRVVQHDAVLATLALLQPPSQTVHPEQKLPALYPQILSVERRDGTDAWVDENQRAAEALSRAVRRAVLASQDFPNARYRLVLASEPASFALLMDLRAVVPWAEWPMQPATSPVRVTLEHAGQVFELQAGAPAATAATSPGARRFEFHKHLASDSQPFDVAAVRVVGLAELPWGWMALASAVIAALLAAAAAVMRQRDERRRAEELLRLGQVGRLNAMGELAAGMAHELNQPLTALLASTQAAARLLDEEPPDLPLARTGMQQAVQQARRASQVVGRLRAAVERPGQAADRVPVALQDVARNALHLVAPDLARLAVTPHLEAPATPVMVMAEPVALEQVVHNLLSNAMQALAHSAAGDDRRISVTVRVREASAGDSPALGGWGHLVVADTGPGIAPDVLPRIFEPFFTTREGGLGLGLSLCETLASGMGGELTAANQAPRGAVFTLSLPLAS